MDASVLITMVLIRSMITSRDVLLPTSSVLMSCKGLWGVSRTRIVSLYHFYFGFAWTRLLSSRNWDILGCILGKRSTRMYVRLSFYIFAFPIIFANLKCMCDLACWDGSCSVLPWIKIFIFPASNSDTSPRPVFGDMDVVGSACCCCCCCCAAGRWCHLYIIAVSKLVGCSMFVLNILILTSLTR